MYELLKDPVSQVIAILILFAVFAYMAWDTMDSLRDSSPINGMFKPGRARPRAEPSAEPPRRSTRPDSSLERMAHPATGEPDAMVRRGPCRGARLSELDREGCQAQYDYCRLHDFNAALFLEDYMRRRFTNPGARARNPPPEDGPMTRDAAYSVLGLASGASEQEIVKAHRALIKKHHPDHGGTHAKAARINQAKDALLG
jgi:hypothetical protein